MKFTKNDLHSLFRYAFSLTNKEESAFDLVSHGVEKVLNRSFVINKIAYAKKCIRNKFFDENKQRTEVTGVELDAPSLEDLEKIAIEKEQVSEVLGHLSSQERELLYLWAVEDYTLQEIAKLTNTPRGTLTSRLSRLKKKLDHLKEEYNE